MLRAAEDADDGRGLHEEVVEMLPCFLCLTSTLHELLAETRNLQLCLDAGEQLASREGLDEIVIGPGTQSLDGGLLTSSCREQDDRNRAGTSIGTQGCQQGKPIKARHHHIGENQVR